MKTFFVVVMSVATSCAGSSDSASSVTPFPPTPTPTQKISGNAARDLPMTMSGGYLNAKARSLPDPIYPAEARAINASGTIEVAVLVDEEGKVVLATATSGNKSLRKAAEKAAKSAEFQPLVLAGQKRRVSGILKYEFKP
ncbi:MAG: TonB family protein [Acidobacteriota bacterium]